MKGQYKQNERFIQTCTKWYIHTRIFKMKVMTQNAEQKHKLYITYSECKHFFKICHSSAVPNFQSKAVSAFKYINKRRVYIYFCVPTTKNSQASKIFRCRDKMNKQWGVMVHKKAALQNFLNREPRTGRDTKIFCDIRFLPSVSQTGNNLCFPRLEERRSLRNTVAVDRRTNGRVTQERLSAVCSRRAVPWLHSHFSAIFLCSFTIFAHQLTCG